MFRNEFHIINLALHLNYTSTAAWKDEYEYDPWHKPHLVVDLFNRPQKYLYIPDQSIFLNESLIGMKNKTAYIQHTPSKRYCCFWFRKFKLCRGNRGYIFHTELYSEYIFLPKMTLMTWHKMVMNLADECGFFHRDYHLYTDNCWRNPIL
jgi:hypothetical protein